jgi:hypothetical protein
MSPVSVSRLPVHTLDVILSIFDPVLQETLLPSVSRRTGQSIVERLYRGARVRTLPLRPRIVLFLYHH